MPCSKIVKEKQKPLWMGFEWIWVQNSTENKIQQTPTPTPSGANTMSKRIETDKMLQSATERPSNKSVIMQMERLILIYAYRFVFFCCRRSAHPIRLNTSRNTVATSPLNWQNRGQRNYYKVMQKTCIERSIFQLTFACQRNFVVEWQASFAPALGCIKPNYGVKLWLFPQCISIWCLYMYNNCRVQGKF